MDKNHDLALLYTKILFEHYVNSPNFKEENIEQNILKFKGYYDFASHQLKYFEDQKKQ